MPDTLYQRRRYTRIWARIYDKTDEIAMTSARCKLPVSGEDAIPAGEILSKEGAEHHPRYMDEEER